MNKEPESQSLKCEEGLNCMNNQTETKTEKKKRKGKQDNRNRGLT
jgi:hypothetical protein